MKTYLVTGAAGFIGANFIKYMLAEHQDIKIVVLDLLTYAGNLGTIAGDIVPRILVTRNNCGFSILRST